MDHIILFNVSAYALSFCLTISINSTLTNRRLFYRPSSPSFSLQFLSSILLIRPFMSISYTSSSLLWVNMINSATLCFNFFMGFNGPLCRLTCCKWYIWQKSAHTRAARQPGFACCAEMAESRHMSHSQSLVLLMDYYNLLSSRGRLPRDPLFFFSAS